MDFLLNKIDESWDTPTNLDDKMNDLKRKLEELNALKEDMESRKSTELLHPRKKLKREVELWFRNVERINDEIQDLEQKIEENSFVSRGFFKQSSFKKIQEVEELFQQGKSHDSLVVDNLGWIGQALSTTTLFGEAAEICMAEIWTYLMGANVQKIGVWGMGGIGKTTIMKLIHNQLLKETKKFNIVIWITVSKEMNIFKMQNRIARAMKATLDEDEDEIVRAGMICEMLACKGKYVLILDDLWDKLSLEELGIPEPSNGSKLLVITRLLDVCFSLGCREVRVLTLSKLDAWNLFLEKVGLDVSSHPDLLLIAESVAEECAGLPLAIVTIARSMKGVDDVRVWRNALHELQGHVKSVNEIEGKVFQQLQFSYDRLRDEKVKHCFLCCALYPEDYEIDIDELIKLWIAEGLVEEMDSMQMQIDKGHAILNKLINSCLIEKNTIDRGIVKLHDVVRDMALRITSVRPQFLVRAGMQLKETPDVQDWNEGLEKVSLMENWYLKIPSQMSPPKCPNLTTLLLSNCFVNSIPECFFEQMHGLKNLDLSFNSIKSLPNSISNLKSLTSLLLGWCEDLEKLPAFSKLQALKKLDLGGTNIKDIPHGMERLVNLKYLDLSETRITEMADGILAKFTSLQHLALINIGELFLKGEEIGGLRNLEFFQGQFDDLKELNSYVQALHAQKKSPSQYCICVGDNPLEDIEYESSEKFVELNGCNIIRTAAVKVLSDVEALNVIDCIADLCDKKPFFSCFIPLPHNRFSSLSRIHIFNCKNIQKLFSSNWVFQNLQNLDRLCVAYCEDMEEIIASEPELEEERGTITFPKLCWLELRNLPELKSICGANVVMARDSIKRVDIVDCPKLKRRPGEPSLPSLRTINAYPKKQWELVEWDLPNAKPMLFPYIKK